MNNIQTNKSEERSERVALAVDLGASGGKCFVGRFTPDDFRMEEVHRFEHEGVTFFAADRQGGDVERRTYWNDTGIYHEILRGLQACRRACPEGIDTLGIDTWGADAQWIDAHGESLGKLYCYRDHRLDNMGAELLARLPAERLYRLTGIHFQPFNLTNQLLWFATRRRELLKLAAKVLPVPSLLNYYLGGCTQVDSTWASVTQAMDARRRSWSRPILAALGIPRRLLPEIVPPGTIVGGMYEELARTIGFDRAPSIVAVGSHDTASAYLAAPVENPAESLIVSSGTWSLVGRLVPRPITSPEAMRANLSNEGGFGNIRCLKNCMGTWIVQELLRGWEVLDGRRLSWKEVDEMTPSAPPLRAFIDPDDAAFYNPPDMEKAIREWLSSHRQPQPEGRGAILRLVYESLALKYRVVNEQLNRIIGAPARVVHIVGGGCGNRLLNQFTADAIGLPVLTGPREATAVGNLVAQALATGHLATPAAAQPLIRKAFPPETFRPGRRAPWEEAYRRFLRMQDS